MNSTVDDGNKPIQMVWICTVDADSFRKEYGKVEEKKRATYLKVAQLSERSETGNARMQTLHLLNLSKAPL